MRLTLALFVLLALHVAVRAEEPKGPTGDLSPDLMIVADFDATKGHLHLRMTQYREQEIQELSVGPGVTLKTEKVIGLFRAERFLALKDCKVMRASGQAVAAEDFADVFKVGAVVIVTTDANPPGKAFLQLLRPETVIVIGPPVKPDPRLKPAPPPPPMPK
jgi:hypothetical protein